MFTKPILIDDAIAPFELYPGIADIKALIAASQKEGDMEYANKLSHLIRGLGSNATDLLLLSLKDENPKNRLLALSSLSTEDLSIDHVIISICLNDKDDAVRKQAYDTLVRMGESSIENRILCLNSTNEKDYLLNEAVKEIIKLGEAPLEHLIFRLYDVNEDVRQTAIHVLRKHLGDKLRLERLDGQPIVPLVLALNDKEIEVRRKAAIVLGELGDKRAAKPLIFVALHDKSWIVRMIAISALRELGDARTIKLLIAALHDKGNPYRKLAAYYLGESGDKRAVKPLITALHDKDFGIRESAAKALGKLGDERAVKPLITAIHQDKDWIVRESAAKALGELGDVGAVKPLITALHDKHSKTREYAAKALGKLGDERAVKPLITTMQQDRDWQVRESVAEALGELGNTQALEPLITALHDESFGVRKYAAKALGKLGDERAIKPLITAMHQDKEWIVRASVAEALGMLGGARAVKTLLAAMYDNDSPVRKEAADALLRLGWTPKNSSDKVHLWISKKDEQSITANWSMIKKVLLHDFNAGKISYALYAFIAIGKEEIIPVLIDMLNKKGTETMAEAFLNCGHDKLEAAGRHWASVNGYGVWKGDGAHPVSWGRF